jgi:hypothetical protein
MATISLAVGLGAAQPVAQRVGIVQPQRLDVAGDQPAFSLAAHIWLSDGR